MECIQGGKQIENMRPRRRSSESRLIPPLREFSIPAAQGSDEIDAIELSVFRRIADSKAD